MCHIVFFRQSELKFVNIVWKSLVLQQLMNNAAQIKTKHSLGVDVSIICLGQKMNNTKDVSAID